LIHFLHPISRQRAAAAGLAERWNWLRSQPAFRRQPVPVLARLAAWRAWCLAGREAEVELCQSRVRLRLPPEWRGVAKLIYAFRDDYEPELAFLRQYLRPGMVMVDAGACYGIYSLVAASRIGPDGLVLAIEPAANSYERLAGNVRLNRLVNVRLLRVALWDRRGNAFLRHAADPGRNSLSEAEPARASSETVSLRKLDDVLDEQQISRVDVIKLDIEGAEAPALRGAIRTLRAQRPVVIFEVNPRAAAAFGLGASEAAGILRSLGYAVYQTHPSGTLRACAESAGGNLVALPD
jgi:FkbM family methyltransferase